MKEKFTVITWYEPDSPVMQKLLSYLNLIAEREENHVEIILLYNQNIAEKEFWNKFNALRKWRVKAMIDHDIFGFFSDCAKVARTNIITLISPYVFPDKKDVYAAVNYVRDGNQIAYLKRFQPQIKIRKSQNKAIRSIESFVAKVWSVILSDRNELYQMLNYPVQTSDKALIAFHKNTLIEFTQAKMSEKKEVLDEMNFHKEEIFTGLMLYFCRDSGIKVKSIERYYKAKSVTAYLRKYSLLHSFRIFFKMLKLNFAIKGKSIGLHTNRFLFPVFQISQVSLLLLNGNIFSYILIIFHITIYMIIIKIFKSKNRDIRVQEWVRYYFTWILA